MSAFTEDSYERTLIALFGQIGYGSKLGSDIKRELTDRLLKGETIVLVTDAGTPGISDPGEVLTRMAIDAGIKVSALPGASACLTALILSGLPTRRFVF